MYQQEPGYWHHPMQDIEPAPDYACSNVAVSLQAVLDQFVVGSDFHPSNRGPSYDLRPSFRRFCALLWLMDPSRYFEGRTESQVAPCLGVTRSAFSRIVRELSEATGIRNKYMKREGAVSVYRVRQERIWKERGEVKAGREAQMFLDV